MTVIPFTGTGVVGDGAIIQPDLILENAKGDFQQLIVAGFNQDRVIDIRSSHGSREALWILHRAIIHLMMETE